MEALCWTLFSAVAVVSAFFVVTRKNPLYGAVWLIAFFSSMSGIYVFLQASFLAAVQLFIYVGAIIVLYLFVIMMVDFEKLKREDRPPLISPVPAFFLSSGLFLLLVVPLRSAIRQGLKAGSGPLEAGFGSTPWMAQELYKNYPFPIELASVLLVIALVGAFALTGRFMNEKKKYRKKEQEEKAREDALVS